MRDFFLYLFSRGVTQSTQRPIGHNKKLVYAVMIELAQQEGDWDSVSSLILPSKQK